MKQIPYLMILILSTVFINSCVPEDDDGEPDPDDVVTFVDYKLEQCVRDRIQKPEGEIYYEDVSGLPWLLCTGYGIEKLDGIENLKNLRETEFGNNNIKDVTPLGKCVKLEELNLSKNEIEDASPLGSLVNLEKLIIQGNNINNLEFINNMIILKTFYIDNNPVDIIPRFRNTLELTEISFGKCNLENINNM